MCTEFFTLEMYIAFAFCWEFATLNQNNQNKSQQLKALSVVNITHLCKFNPPGCFFYCSLWFQCFDIPRGLTFISSLFAHDYQLYLLHFLIR